MSIGRGVSTILWTVLLLGGCGSAPIAEENTAACESRSLRGDFTPLRKERDDRVVATAVSAAAKAMGTSGQGVWGDYAGYEGRKRGDGARCFQFVSKSCGVGGEVTMCVTPSLEVQEVMAGE